MPPGNRRVKTIEDRILGALRTAHGRPLTVPMLRQYPGLISRRNPELQAVLREMLTAGKLEAFHRAGSVRYRLTAHQPAESRTET